ncbi:VOC family protein [Microvirga pudoricolor]|uniref:VOC family protein n=1 Tax=Microvirga pudoricolor TaxID=2778729 RepID=UPI0019506946|nr:VOC family protein [Microvirga pudoricolor]MBM6595118.1 VOC family protein [Microvirga pudoricolor]
MPRPYSLDHCSLLVRDLETSLRFYQDVFGFKIISIEPGHPQIRWLSINGLGALHLTEGDAKAIHLEKAVHFALSTSDLEGVISDLGARGIPFSDFPGHESRIGSAPGGYRQIFIQDPDGYWVEINDHGTSAG